MADPTREEVEALHKVAYQRHDVYDVQVNSSVLVDD